MTAQSNALQAKILAAAKEAGYVQKSSRNTGQGYNYAGDEAITEKFREAFLKNGLIAYPDNVEFVNIEVLPREGKDTPNVLVHVKGNYVISDGEDAIYVQSLGAGIDVGDKAVYKALTGFRKYAFRNAVMMATGDDPEAAQDDEKKPVAGSKAGKAAVQASVDKAADDVVGTADTAKATQKQKNLIFAKANEVGLSKEALGNLRLSVTGKQSSAQFTSEDIDKMLAAMDDTALLAAASAGGEVAA